MQITKIIERDMGHRLLDHASKCRNLHGHRYKVEITLAGGVKNKVGEKDNGMVLDFSEIKKIAKDFIDTEWDHGYMFQVGDPIGVHAKELGLKSIEVAFPPTAECIAEFLFSKLDELYKYHCIDVVLDSLILRETPTSYVTFRK